MSKNSRSEEILQLVNSRGVISVAELSEKTYSSRSTIRRDLEKLEQQGLLRRHHGGAESVLSLRPPQIIRRQRNQSEKYAVAAKASALVSGVRNCVFKYKRHLTRTTKFSEQRK